jgi:hypothetical protein
MNSGDFVEKNIKFIKQDLKVKIMIDYIEKETKLNAKWYEIEGGDDHYLIIYKLPYDDLELYNVLMIDAYRTPTSNLMSKEEIKEIYKIEL